MINVRDSTNKDYDEEFRLIIFTAAVKTYIIFLFF